MNWNRANKLLSFAHYFSILAFLFITSVTITTKAADCKMDKQTLDDCKDKAKYRKDNLQLCVMLETKCSSQTGTSDNSPNNLVNLTPEQRKQEREENDCKDLKRRADDKKDDYFKACKDAGLGGASCTDKVADCDRIGSEEEYTSGATLLRAFATAAVPNQTPGTAISSCPKYSGQGFYERKDKLTQKLKDTQKELKDNKKEIADLNKDFNDDVKKIQEDIADAQKEYQEKQTEIKKGQRDRAAEQAKQAADMAQNIRKLENTILQKQQEKDQIYADKSQSLAQMTDDVAKSTCMDSVREAYIKRRDALKTGGQTASSKSLIKTGNTSKNFVEMSYKQCMAKFYNARLNLMRTSDAKVETAEKDIRDAQSTMDNLKTQLSQMSSLEQQAQQDENTTLTQQQQALQQKIQRATSQLQSLQQTTQQKSAAMVEEQNSLNNELKSISNQIAGLGAEPADASTTGKMQDVSTAADAYKSAVRNAKSGTCSYNDDIFGEKGSSTKTGRTEKASGSNGSNKGTDGK